MIESEHFQTSPLRPEVDWSNVNVNPTTGLASDYLNHYADLTMLFEMLSSMPDCIDGIREWRPVDYTDHFERSGLKYSKQILLAYEDAPHVDKNALNEVRAHYDPLIMASITLIDEAANTDDPDLLATATGNAYRLTSKAIAELNRVINKVPVSL